MNPFRTLLSLLGLSRHSRPEDIPKKLDAATLARVQEEAGTLRDLHRVDVQPMAPGELPIPRRADD